jgi:hypothetical protein
MQVTWEAVWVVNPTASLRPHHLGVAVAPRSVLISNEFNALPSRIIRN